ncbi:MAG: triose-phosphate isomerase [Candidatus Omnitrophica bacterium]|nr:triose-phosphate isomerase [Candidatus Omnitrophota bacterium]
MTAVPPRRPIIAGNWKMNGTLPEARKLTQEILQGLRGQTDVDVILCPPFTALSTVGEILKGSPLFLGAQDMHWESSGAFTGEISPVMLKEIGCRFCIIGHSERRAHFGDTDPVIHRKLLAALEQGLNPILCVGETLQQRENGKTWEIIEGQLKAALEGIESDRIARLVTLAYEPVWAIGTGQNATGTQAQEVHGSIRAWLTGRIGKSQAQAIRIQYGGSVKSENAGELLGRPDVDGALVGGASLNAKGFISIVESALQKKEN